MQYQRSKFRNFYFIFLMDSSTEYISFRLTLFTQVQHLQYFIWKGGVQEKSQGKVFSKSTNLNEISAQGISSNWLQRLYHISCQILLCFPFYREFFHLIFQCSFIMAPQCFLVFLSIPQISLGPQGSVLLSFSMMQSAC